MYAHKNRSTKKVGLYVCECGRTHVFLGPLEVEVETPNGGWDLALDTGIFYAQIAAAVTAFVLFSGGVLGWWN